VTTAHRPAYRPCKSATARFTPTETKCESSIGACTAIKRQFGPSSPNIQGSISPTRGNRPPSFISFQWRSTRQTSRRSSVILSFHLVRSWHNGQAAEERLNLCKCRSKLVAFAGGPSKGGPPPAYAILSPAKSEGGYRSIAKRGFDVVSRPFLQRSFEMDRFSSSSRSKKTRAIRRPIDLLLPATLKWDSSTTRERSSTAADHHSCRGTRGGALRKTEHRCSLDPRPAACRAGRGQPSLFCADHAPELSRRPTLPEQSSTGASLAI
jgi:hypothetical protein